MGGSEECQLLTFASNSMRMSACVRAKASNKSINTAPIPRIRLLCSRTKKVDGPRSHIDRLTPASAVPRSRGHACTYHTKSNASHINQWLKGILRTDNRISPLLRPPACHHQSQPSRPLAPTRQVFAWAGRNNCSAAGWPPTPPVQQAVSSLVDQAGWHHRGSARRHPSVGCDP